MKKFPMVFVVLSTLAVPAVHAEEERFVDKAARTSKKTGEAIEQGIQKGASAANKGVTKAFGTVNDKVLKPADGWIQDKVGNKGGAQKPADK
ncbi:MAG: hypothetical protein Q8R72_15540 [Hylemonella sp.]|nr:hypothetical protein [Hylemonella sp.]